MYTPSEENEEIWVQKQRLAVLDYLASQKCKHGGVAEWPAFHIDPYLALWAVQSVDHPGRIGWWAISGDVPTDYMSSSSGYHPRDAMRYFSKQWLSISEYMKKGQAHPDSNIGRPELWPTMAPLLEKRSTLLRKYADDDSNWSDE